MRRLAHPVSQQELDSDQRLDDAVGPVDEIVIALHPQRFEVQPLLIARGAARDHNRDHRDGCGREVELKLEGAPELAPVGRDPRDELVHTITLPSSVTASSMSSAAPLMSISLWARPEGIIGKQFSFGSTTQSKITGLLTLIISRIAPSRSPGFSQRMPTA